MKKLLLAALLAILMVSQASAKNMICGIKGHPIHGKILRDFPTKNAAKSQGYYQTKKKPCVVYGKNGGLWVSDGDTIYYKGEKIRLYAIDAVERDQYCRRGRYSMWSCGREAGSYLLALIEDRQLRCDKQDIDRYGRSVSICYADDIDVNQEMVRRGYAIAYRKFNLRYVRDEREAKKNKRGIWNSTFEPPVVWRHKSRQ